jgi:hypothetical protein
MRSLVSGLVLLTAIGAQCPTAFASTSSKAETCLGASTHLRANFDLDDSGPRAQIMSIKVAGLDPTLCNDDPVNLQLLGNADGDPSTAASRLLSTLDSQTNPCTGADLAVPILVSNGTVALPACAADTTAVGSAVDVHDLTLMIVRIRSDEVAVRANGSGIPQACPQTAESCVLGEKVVRQHAPSGPSARSLAFTGAWIALFVLTSAAAIGLGLLMSLIRRRRRGPIFR